MDIQRAEIKEEKENINPREQFFVFPSHSQYKTE